MILTIFIIGVIFASILLFFGLTNKSFSMAYFSMFVFLLLGLFLLNQGIEIDNGIYETTPGSGEYKTLYETHTINNDPIINLLANTFFYLPIVGLLLSTFYALKGFDRQTRSPIAPEW